MRENMQDVSLNSSIADVLHFQILIYSIFAAFSTNARLLPASERRLDSRYGSFIDPDETILKLFRDPPGLADVRGVEVAWTKQT